MVMVGADPDALERGAAQLRAAADEIDQQARTLPAELQAVWWMGQVATRFMQMLGSDHIPAMQSTTQFLRNAADELIRQAAEQRETSSAESMMGTPGGHGSGGRTRSPAPAPELPAAEIAALTTRLEELRSADAGAQTAWWEGLSDAQRAWLMAERAGELTALLGLPAAVLTQARSAYKSKIASSIQVRTATISAKAGATVPIAGVPVRLEGGFTAQRVTYADGSVQLSLELEAGVGLSIEAVEALRRAGVGGTFRFDTEAEADAFLDGLRRELIPNKRELVQGIFAPQMLAPDAAADVIAYLVRNRDHLESVEGSTGSGVEAKIPGIAEAAGRGDISVKVDGPAGDPGTLTVEASRQISGQANGGFLGVSGSVEVAAALAFDGTTPQTLSFDLDFQGGVSGGVFEGLKVSTGVTRGGSAHIEFDLSDPKLRAAADRAVAAMAEGDVNGAIAALSGVMDRAQVVVQLDQGSVSTAGVDAGIAGASIEKSTTSNHKTWLKAPGGAFYEAQL